MKTRILALAACILAPLALRAESVEIIASADTTLREEKPATNYGAVSELRAGAVDGGPQRRTLLRFDIGAAVPAGATITAARLTLEALDAPEDGAAPHEFEIRRVRKFWNEGTGEGGDILPGEASWESRAHPQARWTRPGGARAFDFAAVPSATATVGAAGARTFGPTPGLVADVQHWLDNPQRNEGWMLTQAGGSDAGGVRVFAAREDAARAPRLTVEFTPAPADLESSAQYDVVFRATWSASTHPRDFPPGAHWSGLVGGLHAPSVSFWGRGTTASRGIQELAELGSKTVLLDEVNAAIAAGTANRTLSGGSISGGTGTVTLRFAVDRSHPLVTLTAMIAPSPDWFVGVRGLPLIEQGSWVSRKSVMLFPYDAGTDSGATFRSPDFVTDPRGVISRIIKRPLAVRGRVAPMGTFTFIRVAPAP